MGMDAELGVGIGCFGGDFGGGDKNACHLLNPLMS
jgi:hypothetical protein